MRTLSTKVHDGTVEEVEEFQKEEGIESRSEALRRLIRSGLEGRDRSAADPFLFATTTAGAVAALLALGGSLHPAAGVVGLLVWFGGLIYSRL